MSAVEIATGAVEVLKELLKQQGFQTPDVVFDESKTTFHLKVNGGPATSNANFEQRIVSTYWRANLTFTQQDPLLYSDTFTAGLIVSHFAEPHPTDTTPSTAMNLHVYLDSVRANDDKKSGTLGRTIKATADHVLGHYDNGTATLRLDVKYVSAHGNNVVSWSFDVTVNHSDIRIDGDEGKLIYEPQV